MGKESSSALPISLDGPNPYAAGAATSAAAVATGVEGECRKITIWTLIARDMNKRNFDIVDEYAIQELSSVTA